MFTLINSSESGIDFIPTPSSKNNSRELFDLLKGSEVTEADYATAGDFFKFMTGGAAASDIDNDGWVDLSYYPY